MTSLSQNNIPHRNQRFHLCRTRPIFVSCNKHNNSFTNFRYFPHIKIAFRFFTLKITILFIKKHSDEHDSIYCSRQQNTLPERDSRTLCTNRLPIPRTDKCTNGTRCRYTSNPHPDKMQSGTARPKSLPIHSDGDHRLRPYRYALL